MRASHEWGRRQRVSRNGSERWNRRARRRAGRAHCRVRARPARRSGVVFEADGTRRRHRQDGRVRRLPLRPRRAPLLHEAVAGAAPLGGDARRRAPRPPAALAHLLRRQVLRLPAAGEGRRSAGSGIIESVLCALSYFRCAPRRPARSEETFEDWVDVALRHAALRRVLPPVHGEGVGHPRLGDPRGVGGAADQGLLVLEGAAVRRSRLRANR